MLKQLNINDSIVTIKNDIDRMLYEFTRRINTRLIYVSNDRKRLLRYYVPNNRKKNKIVDEYSSVLDSIELVCETFKNYARNSLRPVYMVIEKGIIEPSDVRYFNAEMLQISNYFNDSCRKINEFMRQIDAIKYEYNQV